MASPDLNLSASEESVISAVTGLGLDVYEIEMPEDSALKYDKYGLLAAPFYVLSFSGPLRTSPGNRSMLGAANDPMRVVVSAQTYAGDVDSLRTAHSNLINLLTGFYPSGSEEMILGGGNGFSLASNVVRPTLYARVTFYTYETNMSSG